MPVPSVVVFDLGKVLVDFDYGIASSKIAKACGMDSVAVKQVHRSFAKLLYRFETGLITNEQFFTKKSVRTPASEDPFEIFRGHFADIFWEIEPMIAWNATLRRERHSHLHFLEYKWHRHPPHS